MAAVGRVHPRRRQHERDAVRARHPHLRELHPQHAGHLRHPGDPQADSPANHRRPEPRIGPARHGGADGAGGGRGRRRRPDHRGPRRSRSRPQRRCPIDVPLAVRPAHGRAAHHRPGDRPWHLPRAGGAQGMGSLSKAPFTRIGIVGVGLIGGSIGLAVKRRWPDVEIIGVDRQAVLETARRLCVVDGGGETLAAAAGAELVVLAAPVLQNAAALRALPDHLDHGLVTDAGSTKRTMMETAAALPDRLEYIGGHPLAGAAASGVEAARPDLFDDRPWILTPSSRASESAIDLVSQLVNGLRAVPTVMPADDHDRLLAYLSHLPQLAVTALMHVVGGYAGPEGLALAGRGLRDTTRL